jgi:hypothetical protein
MGEQATPRIPVSVDTTHLGPAASRYDAKSNSVNTLLNNTYLTQVAEDLRTACGNDESGQKIYASIADIQKDLVKDTRLLIDVLGLTGDGIRDMRDAYEQAETNAEILARGSDPTQHIGSNLPNPGQNPGSDNTSSPNTDTSSGNGHTKH